MRRTLTIFIPAVLTVALILFIEKTVETRWLAATMDGLLGLALGRVVYYAIWQWDEA